MTLFGNKLTEEFKLLTEFGNRKQFSVFNWKFM